MFSAALLELFDGREEIVERLNGIGKKEFGRLSAVRTSIGEAV